MARKRSAARKSRIGFDEFGGGSDGSISIVLDDGVFHNAPRSVASAVRYFLARAEFGVTDTFPDVLAIVAALPKEGTTFVSRSLAAVMAYDTELTVAWVDLNWRLPRPAAADADPDELPATLAAAVELGAPVDSILVPTSNPRLSLIDAGELPISRHNAVGASQALKHVLDEISERFDHVVLDLPAVLTSSDATRLAQLADAYILVVRQGRTAASQVDAALDELQGSRSLGVILNQATSRVPRSLRRILVG